MATGFETWVARRYLKVRGREGFITLIGWLSVLGVAVGVTALIVVLSVMAGFETDLREKILGTTAHVKVLPESGGTMEDADAVAARARRQEGVESAHPYVERKMLLSARGTVQGVVLRGAPHDARSGLAGLDQALEKLAGEPPENVVIGREMARNLGLMVGDRIRLVSPGATLTPAGPVPRVRSFRIAGLFVTGLYEYDTTWVFAQLAEAADFLRIGAAANGVDVRVEEAFDAPRIGLALAGALGAGVRVRDWTQMNRSLFEALKLEKLAMFLFLGLTVLVAAFNIASTLIMVVLGKSRDIGVLKALGAANRSVLKIFLYEGTMIGGLGTLLGTTAGVALSWALKRYEFIRLPSDVYYIDTLPVVMDPLTIGVVAAGSLALCMAAALYPAWQASRMDPVETIRYE